jgi:DNA-binding HxlR family transcriptional regulator
MNRSDRLSERLRRGELLQPDCPSRDVLQHVTSRWGVLLLVVLMGAPARQALRFSELRRSIGGISEKMLSQTLKWLESDGLLERRQLDTVPPHVEYRLTALGRQVGRRVQGLADWIETSMPAIMEARASRAKADAPTGRVHRL